MPRNGATGFVAGVMTAPWESMLHAASEIVEAANQLEEDAPAGARCLGVHFEGPFLNPKFRRIHRNEWLLPASAARAQEMVDACKGACLLVTMAPEIDGASDALRVFLENGVVCSAGHTARALPRGHARHRPRASARSRTPSTGCRRSITAIRRSSPRSSKTGARSCR